MRFSVLGQGVAGLCVATALAERGAAVEVITPENAPPPVSRLAGGMLAPFCEGDQAPPVVVAAGQGAADWWAARFAGVVRRGTLVIAPPRDTGDLRRFARATTGHMCVDPATLEPELEGRFSAGLIFANEAHMDPRAALDALRLRLLAMGAVFRSGAPSGRVIDCTGMAAGLAALRAVRGEMVLVHAPDVRLTRTMRLLHPRFPCYIVPRGDGRYLIGATMVESADSGPVTARALVELLSSAYIVHPAFAEAKVIETAAGLRPSFADNIPAILHSDGVVYVNGMYRHGFLMAPHLAETLAASLIPEVAHAC